MSENTPIRVPDIGDFDAVEVIEVLVSVGDTLSLEDPIVTLETDKATMDIPAPSAGRVASVEVTVGAKVGEGDVLIHLEAAAASETPAAEPAVTQNDTPAAAPIASTQQVDADQHAPFLVIGGGVAGYTAAFRAADLGMSVTLVERWPMLGGVCLNVGCIPSKALLHMAKVIDDAADMVKHGIDFGGPPKIEPGKIVDWKNSVVNKLTGGLGGMAKQRKVKVVHGTAAFVTANALRVTGDDGEQTISFDQCVIAAGSEPTVLPGAPDDPRIVDSTGALELGELPDRLLVIGGGIIGLEMAAVYNALGVGVTIVELTGNLIPEADADLVKPLHKHIAARYDNILLNTKVEGLTAEEAGIRVRFSDKDGEREDVFGRVLVAIGRRPNGNKLEAQNAGVTVNPRGFIDSDRQMRTNVPHIFSIGDVRGQPMLAHKGSHEGKVAAEVAHGEKRAFDARVIPSVAYTDPEVAWVGPTEASLKRDGVAYEKGVFPWAASGRALAMGAEAGMTKLLFAKDTHRVIAMGAVGTHAGDLVSEAALAIEMGCDAEDIGLTIHPHPTLSETVAMAAEMFDGTITDLIPKKRAR
ncbi:MAG: dihydrolipoyl dehydrogenase [Gammaproteobacteria bacterium]